VSNLIVLIVQRELKPLHIWHLLSWLLFCHYSYGDLELVVILMTSASSLKWISYEKLIAFSILEFLLVFIGGGYHL
jgi:hypothetical protein